MEIVNIPLSEIEPSPMNPRKTFDQRELEELAENIDKQGLLQPITVRPIAQDPSQNGGKPRKLEIVCGERRYQAFKELRDKYRQSEGQNKFDTIAAIVREMTDDEAFDAMITENLQRKDVEPMEEAFAFAQLIEKGSSAEEIAARFGKSVRFVQDRVKLNNLIPEFAEMIKSGQLPVVSAMIFSKLDRETQMQIHKRVSDHDHISKTRAQNEVNALFRYINRSVWGKNDIDFKGSCGRKCSECEKNTANHGCLFYEMNATEDGKCTDEKKFEEKTLSYILEYLSGQNLLPKDSELDGRKVVVISTSQHYGNNELRKRYVEEIERRGWKVVDPYETFANRCWYPKEDERIERLLRDGEIYPVIDIFRYQGPGIDEYFCYVSKNSGKTKSETDSVPLEVGRLCSAYRTESNSTSFAAPGASAIVKHAKPTADELNPIEKQVLSMILLNNRSIRTAVGLPEFGTRDEALAFVVNTPGIFEKCVRHHILQSLKNTPEIHQTAPLLDAVGAMWCRDEYVKAIETAKRKHEKKLAEIREQLKELGYGTDGKKLRLSDEELDAIPFDVTDERFEKYAEMRRNHPDAILLCRTGDFYEVYGEDAQACAEILGLTLTRKKDSDGKEIKIGGFPHFSIEAYLPKIVRAGRRTAIIEEF